MPIRVTMPCTSLGNLFLKKVIVPGALKRHLSDKFSSFFFFNLDFIYTNIETLIDISLKKPIIPDGTLNSPNLTLVYQKN